MDKELAAWFEREILVHEAALVRYLLRTWKHREDVYDLRQEVYVRVYEAAARARPQSPKSFLFATARHLMTDRLRRERIVSIEATADLEVLNVLVDEVSPEQRVSARQELRRLAAAFDQLPPKCREVLWMRKVEDRPQREVAQHMGTSERAVEKHITKGIRFLAQMFYGREAAQEMRDGVTDTASARDTQVATGSPTGGEHGQQTDE